MFGARGGLPRIVACAGGMRLGPLRSGSPADWFIPNLPLTSPSARRVHGFACRAYNSSILMYHLGHCSATLWYDRRGALRQSTRQMDWRAGRYVRLGRHVTMGRLWRRYGLAAGWVVVVALWLAVSVALVLRVPTTGPDFAAYLAAAQALRFN